MSYKDDVADYQAANSNATASEIADALGCSVRTVRRHWSGPGVEKVTDGGDVAPDDDGDTGESDSDPDSDPDIDGADGDAMTESDVAPEAADEGDEEEPDEADFNDDDSKTYECGECDEQIEYLQKTCDCGAKPAWSALDGGDA